MKRRDDAAIHRTFMRIQTFRSAFAACLVALVVSCSDHSVPTTPSVNPIRSIESSIANNQEGNWQGGSAGWNGALVKCEQQQAFEGSGEIGPAGGMIVAGSHRLIIPPGALTRTVHIAASVPAGESVFISFEPSGLQFRKPAGLVLDADGCDIDAWQAPDVVYIDDSGEVQERIEAIYLPAWKTVAAPISHFSGYAIAW